MLKKLLRHVVLFKFKDAATPEQVQHIADSFAALSGKVSQIADFEWGMNNSPEMRNEGFTHCFILSYRSEQDLAAYQLHPAHLDFQKILQPHLDKVLVIDYWIK